MLYIGQWITCLIGLTKFDSHTDQLNRIVAVSAIDENVDCASQIKLLYVDKLVYRICYV